MPPTIALQIICTVWTKASRGGRGAQKRNAVPLALPCDVKTGRFTAQIHRFGESDGFTAPLEPLPKAQRGEVREMNQSFLYRCGEVFCDWDVENQTCTLRWSNIHGGAPRTVLYDQSGNEKPLQRNLVIALNTWGRGRWMERFSDIDTGQWWYEHTVANLAYFQGPIHPEVFSRSAASVEFSHLPILR